MAEADRAEHLAAKFLEINRQQLANYQALLKSLQEQEQGIRRGDYRRVSAIGESLQELFVRMEEVKAEIENCRSALCSYFQLSEFDWEKLRNYLPAETWQEINRLLNEQREMLLKAQAENRRNEDLARAELARARETLGQVQKARETVKAYRHSWVPAPRFLDDRT
ncbi:flagellar export chaperone FlgN [Calderihabitans maritimus]|uniref:FlgN family protein n=1 Tax=Calderihabitans maritimus TaxID=1246530 RepID=A0A1Z5HTR5_9FIRM|nr:flagellar export chaperone FlgN [Calderihabitans maritimus]GAW92912.1 hypothetical protein KKC1_20580 [Calderihabitans maritimus]